MKWLYSSHRFIQYEDIITANDVFFFISNLHTHKILFCPCSSSMLFCP